jgi:hypothetical protein
MPELARTLVWIGIPSRSRIALACVLAVASQGCGRSNRHAETGTGNRGGSDTTGDGGGAGREANAGGAGPQASGGASVSASGAGSDAGGSGTSGSSPGGQAGEGGAADSGGSGAGNSEGGGAAAGGAGATAGAGGSAAEVDLCEGLVTDLMPRPMTPLEKPALGQAVVDAEFGTTIRRITEVMGTGITAAIIPMSPGVSAFNADESRLIVYDQVRGHLLYDGKTYEFIEELPIATNDAGLVYWDVSDPDVLHYLGLRSLVRYHVGAAMKETLRDFGDLCESDLLASGDRPAFTSWDSHRIGLTCNGQMFIYDWSSDTVFGPAPAPADGIAPQVAASGTLAFLGQGTGDVLDTSLAVVRSLGIASLGTDASLGQLAGGHDTWNGAVFYGGDELEGPLATWDLVTGTGAVIIGPKNGYPNPSFTQVSAMAYRRPGWVFVSTYFVQLFDGVGTPPTPGLIGLENLIADTNTGRVCRAGRHRSWGVYNAVMGERAKARTVPSPSGTRAVFASDWYGGDSVDTYVLELPSYAPSALDSARE